MENPGPLPMGAVDAADYPARLEAKDMMAAPQEQDSYYIGAGVPSDIAAQYGGTRRPTSFYIIAITFASMAEIYLLYK